MSETEKKAAKKKQLPRYRGHSRLLKAGNSGNLSVPSDMMGVLPDNLLFKPEFTKDGILFKIVDEDKMVADEKAVPAWIKKVTPGSSKAKASGPIPAVDDDHPDNDLSDEDDEPEVDADEIVSAEEGDAEPPTDEDTPF